MASVKADLSFEDGEIKEILDRLEKLGFPSFYIKTVAFEVRHKRFYLNQRHLKRHIWTQKEYKDKTPKLFKLLSRRRNLLCYLYHQDGDLGQLKEARNENDDVLREYPNNITALTIKLHLCLKDDDLEGARHALERLENLQGEIRDREVLVAKAEKAFFYTQLFPQLYLSASDLYKEVLGTDDDGVEVEGPSRDHTRLLDSKHRLLYSLELAMTYNKLMNQNKLGPTQGEDSASSGPDPNLWFDRIFALLLKVIQDAEALVQKSGDQQGIDAELTKIVQGQAWVEVGNAYRKYELKAPKGGIKKDYLPNNMSLDQCFLNAVELCPDDPHVLEKYAINLRYRATNEEGLLEAVGAFDRVLAICPTRHVALHHKALALKEAWYLAEGLEEAKLKDTKAKVHQDRRPQGQGRKKRGKRKEGAYSSIITPESQKQPGYFDKLKSHNPRVKDPKQPHRYLTDALKQCLDAVDATEGTTPRYLIDQGRIYVCLQQYDEAKKCFENAEKERNIYDTSDMSTLYEQWAILLLELTRQDERHEERAKQFCRKSVQLSVAERTRSRMAFYKLRDVLDSQHKKEQDATKTDALEKELAILKKTIEVDDKAKHTFLDLLNRSQENVTMMWDLVEVFVTLGDFAAAFSYVCTLCIHLSDNDQITTISEDQRSMLLNIGLKTADEGEMGTGTNKVVLHTIFQYLAISKGKSTLDSWVDILILAPDSDAPTVQLLLYILRTCCNLNTFLVTTKGVGDIPSGKSVQASAKEALEIAKSLIVVTEDNQGPDEAFNQLVESVLSQKDAIDSIGTSRVSTVGDDTSGHSVWVRSLLSVVTVDPPPRLTGENAAEVMDIGKVKDYIKDMFQGLLF